MSNYYLHEEKFRRKIAQIVCEKIEHEYPNVTIKKVVGLDYDGCGYIYYVEVDYIDRQIYKDIRVDLKCDLGIDVRIFYDTEDNYSGNEDFVEKAFTDCRAELLVVDARDWIYEET